MSLQHDLGVASIGTPVTACTLVRVCTFEQTGPALDVPLLTETQGDPVDRVVKLKNKRGQKAFKSAARQAAVQVGAYAWTPIAGWVFLARMRVSSF